MGDQYAVDFTTMLGLLSEHRLRLLAWRSHEG